METQRSNTFRILGSAAVCVNHPEAVPSARTDQAWTFGLDLTSCPGFLVLHHTVPYDAVAGVVDWDPPLFRPRSWSSVFGGRKSTSVDWIWIQMRPLSPMSLVCLLFTVAISSCSLAPCGCSGVLCHCPLLCDHPSPRSLLRLDWWHGGTLHPNDCPRNSLSLMNISPLPLWILRTPLWVCRLWWLPKPGFQADSNYVTPSIFHVFMGMGWESWFCSMVQLSASALCPCVPMTQFAECCPVPRCVSPSPRPMSCSSRHS